MKIVRKQEEKTVLYVPRSLLIALLLRLLILLAYIYIEAGEGLRG